jgi:hypothetical protein
MNAATASLGTARRPSLGSAYIQGRETIAVPMPGPEPIHAATPEPRVHRGSDETQADAPEISPVLFRTLAEVKGQAQFLLYLADQIEDALDQLVHEGDVCQSSFLCKVLGMYSTQLETKHQGLGDKIAETCQEVYVTVREHDVSA